MASSTFAQQLKSANKTCMVSEGRKKVHATFTDGSQLVEEFDLRTDDLLLRKWLRTTAFNQNTHWEVEVGEHRLHEASGMSGMLSESKTSPVFIRTDTKTAFQWRVRNIDYPIDIFSVTVDQEKRRLMIRTSTKKYYKTFPIEDLDRCNLPLKEESISFTLANRTLLISYKKPPEIIEFERLQKLERSKMKAGKDGDVDCKQS